MAVSSAFDTMKTKCLDEANESEKKEILGKTCPNDCNGNGKCNNGKCQCNEGFGAFDCSKGKSYDIYFTNEGHELELFDNSVSYIPQNLEKGEMHRLFQITSLKEHLVSATKKILGEI